MPKHGEIDMTGAPHVGGSTFAGGTGKLIDCLFILRSAYTVCSLGSFRCVYCTVL